MERYDVYAGLDVGKGSHHLYALSAAGGVLANREVRQCELELEEAFAALAAAGRALVVVDQPNNIGALPIACARRMGCSVAYLPGLAMRRAAGMLPGEAKTDERDAYVIAATALGMPQALRPLPGPDALRAELVALTSYDDDCRADLTREANRLRSHLVECHPAFERALGDAVASPFALKLLERYGGPWGMRKAGRAAVERWAAKQKRVPKALLGRLLDAAWEMGEAPAGAKAREGLAIPACARRIAELSAVRKDVASRMAGLLEGDPAFQALTTMPGVGVKTAAAFIAHVDITLFDSADKLASYAGIAPRTHQSGTSVKGESAPRIGNRALKSVLFLSAFASIRCDPASREYYDRKRAEGKGHNAAVICLARRRLKIMYAIARDCTPYRAAA